MNGTSAVGSTTRTNAASSAPLERVQGNDLLVPPAPMRIGSLDAALGQLLALQSKTHILQAASGKAQISSQAKQRDEALAREEEAHRAERAANDDSGGFFKDLGAFVGHAVVDAAEGRVGSLVDDAIKDVKTAVDDPKFWSDLKNGAEIVGKVSAVVVACAGAVMTGGAGVAGALAVTAAVLSTASVVDSEAGVSARLVGDEAARTIDLGLAIGGAVCGGAGALVAGPSVALSSTAREAVGELGRAGSYVSIGAAALGGAGTMRVAEFHAEAGEAAATAKAAAMVAKRSSSEIDEVIACLKDLQKSHQRATDCVRKTIQMNDDSARAASQGVRA